MNKARMQEYMRQKAEFWRFERQMEARRKAARKQERERRITDFFTRTF